MGNTIPCWEQQVFFFLLFIGFRLRIEWRSICPVYSTLDASAIWPIDFIRSSLIFLLWLHFLLHIHIFVVVADPAMNRADVKVDLTKKKPNSLSLLNLICTAAAAAAVEWEIGYTFFRFDHSPSLDVDVMVHIYDGNNGSKMTPPFLSCWPLTLSLLPYDLNNRSGPRSPAPDFLRFFFYFFFPPDDFDSPFSCFFNFFFCRPHQLSTFLWVCDHRGPDFVWFFLCLTF